MGEGVLKLEQSDARRAIRGEVVMMDWVSRIMRRLRQKRWIQVSVIVLRIVIGFAFLPAGLKKVLGQPFTDPANTGAFHEFLHAFHGTGFFYSFVGAVQLLAAILLMTQRYATIGTVILSPILLAILVFCWSTVVIPTASVVTLMTLGVVFLLAWDVHKWRRLFGQNEVEGQGPLPESDPTIDMSLWTRCGILMLLLYFGNAIAIGGVYRPMGAEWSNPSFIVLQVITVLPLVTFVIDYRRHRRTRKGKG
jgi:uncharacterized membrane protein YphA (DoxX/SURF4 family)